MFNLTFQTLHYLFGKYFSNLGKKLQLKIFGQNIDQVNILYLSLHSVHDCIKHYCWYVVFYVV